MVESSDTSSTPGQARTGTNSASETKPLHSTFSSINHNKNARTSVNDLFLPRDVVTITPQRRHATGTTTATTKPPPPEPQHRAVHRIRLAALEHNFACVEEAANRQRCSVITVVKADGYGHGAIATALHLADCCGAGAFAVATLEEAIHLRRAFENNPPGRWSKQLASHFHVAHNSSHPAAWVASAAAAVSNSVSSEFTTVDVPAMAPAAQSIRPAHIRILVLGPPVGYPRCFDDYYHHNIEVMVSGPEVAASLAAWVADEKERKRLQVERAATESKAQALLQPLQPRDSVVQSKTHQNQHRPTQNGNKQPENGSQHSDTPSSKGPPNTTLTSDSSTTSPVDPMEQPARRTLRHSSNTLGNVSGADLAKEVRALLINQKAAEDASNLEKERQYQQQQRNSMINSSATSRATSTANSTDNSVSSDSSGRGGTNSKNNTSLPVEATANAPTARNGFAGIEAMAKNSRARELAEHKRSQIFKEDSETETRARASGSHNTASVATLATTLSSPASNTATTTARKRLRWHALVDSGMGRLGFKTDVPKPGENRRNSVDVIKELVDAEIIGNAPIEFYGMCTHMADANSTSTYTNSQITRFIALLKRVRAAGISVPTVSTDNSAALLTPNLLHFDPEQILSQPRADSRGFVRVGGAIYGQRPAFPQLKAVSALTASVRHVAILKEGESVGYDRAYVANHDVRIATLTIGFADGYPRLLGNGVGRVEIRGQVFPVAGNVCMDMLMVDLGEAKDTTGVGSSVAVGDTAVLWGPLEDDEDNGQVKLQDLAGDLNTTQSALTCGLDKIRVWRHFL